jgi:hypothetical protein
MKRMLSLVMVLSLFSLGFVGCAEKTETKKETTVETPEGTTTETETKEVEKSGENPPASTDAAK